MSAPQVIIVVDPNPALPSWQTQLYGSTTVLRASSEFELRQLLNQHSASLVIISTQFQPSKCLAFLTALKDASVAHLLPLLFSLDLTEAHASFPLTNWGGKFGLIHSQTNQAEWSALLNRLL
jgi:hypothetical protein